MNGTTIETISLRQGEAPYGNGALLFTETKSEWLWRLFLDEACGLENILKAINNQT